MALQQYDLVIGTISGILMGQADSVEVRNESSTQDVMTIVGGLSGITPGPDKVVIQVSGFIPRAGFDIDVWKIEQSHAFVPVQISLVGSAKKLAVEGDIRNCAISGSVGNTTKLNYEIHCSPGQFE